MSTFEDCLDSYYDTAEIKDTKEFEKFLKTRKPPLSPEKIEMINDKTKNKKEIERILSDQTKEIKKKAEKIENNDEYKLDIDYVLNNEKFFLSFFNYSLNFDNDMNITQIVHDWTNFNYLPYGELKTNYIKNPGERLVIIDKLSKIFSYNFMNTMTNKNYRFDTLNFEICKFIGNLQKSEKEVTNFEYRFIKNILGKLLICLLSSVDRAFSKDSVQINIVFKKAVSCYLKELSYLLKDDNRITYSWNIFEKHLFMSKFDSEIFKYKNAEDLREKLTECYNDDSEFLIEQLIANTLKCYIPTIAFSYFSVIKNVYLISRLLSVYVNKKLYLGKDRDEIMNDLYIISSALTIEYEINFLANINIRCSPTCRNNELSKQTEVYYINHLIAGPQYFILKQLELSLPTLYKTFNSKQ